MKKKFHLTPSTERKADNALLVGYFLFLILQHSHKKFPNFKTKASISMPVERVKKFLFDSSHVTQ